MTETGILHVKVSSQVKRRRSDGTHRRTDIQEECMGDDNNSEFGVNPQGEHESHSP